MHTQEKKDCRRNAATSGILAPSSSPLSVCPFWLWQPRCCEWLWHRPSLPFSLLHFLCLDFLCVRQTHARPLTRPTAPPLGPSFLCCSYPAGACMSFFCFCCSSSSSPTHILASGSLVWSLVLLFYSAFCCFLFLLFDSTHTITKRRVAISVLDPCLASTRRAPVTGCLKNKE